jgi:hypothetical protein
VYSCLSFDCLCDRLFDCPYLCTSLAPSLPPCLPFLFPNRRACKRYATQLFLGARPPAGGPFEFMTFKEFDEQVNRTRVLLKEAGIGKGDKVGRGEARGGGVDWKRTRDKSSDVVFDVMLLVKGGEVVFGP